MKDQESKRHLGSCGRLSRRSRRAGSSRSGRCTTRCPPGLVRLRRRRSAQADRQYYNYTYQVYMSGCGGCRGGPGPMLGTWAGRRACTTVNPSLSLPRRLAWLGDGVTRGRRSQGTWQRCTYIGGVSAVLAPPRELTTPPTLAQRRCTAARLLHVQRRCGRHRLSRPLYTWQTGSRAWS